MDEVVYVNMDCLELEKYISAFVDKDFTGLSDREIDDVEHSIQQCAHCSNEKTMELATKLFVEKHHRTTSCPQDTFGEIQAYLYHIYKSTKGVELL